MVAKGTNLNLSPIYNPQGLVGYWTFDEGSGTIARDSSGYGNDGTLIGGPTWVDGKVGKALGFDGVNDWVNVITGTNLNFINSFSVGFWMNSNFQNDWDVLIGKEFWNSGTGWVIYKNGINNLVFSKGGGPSMTYSNIENLNWVHVIIFNISGSATMYINGVSVLTNSIPISNSSVNLFIGSRHNNNDGASQTDYFNGLIDDVRIYNRALSDAEIQAIYNATR